jgi:hypothetical protein
MEREPIGNRTFPAGSRLALALASAAILAVGVRTARRGGGLPATAGDSISVAPPESEGDGRQQSVPGQLEGLSPPVELGAESATEKLSGPVEVGSPPLGIAPPEESSKAADLTGPRFRLAICSVTILAFIVVATFVTIWRGQNVDGLTRVLEIIFAPILALVAAAVAFYYRGSSL